MTILPACQVIQLPSDPRQALAIDFATTLPKDVPHLRRSIVSRCAKIHALTGAAIHYRPFGARHLFSENEIPLKFIAKKLPIYLKPSCQIMHKENIVCLLQT